MKHYFRKMRGEPNQRPSPTRPPSEIAWSWLASFIGIYAVYLVNSWLGIADHENLYLIGSFGASAVLIYGAPTAELSQPRNFVGGHLISALAGVLMQKLVPGNIALAAALAVSLAIAGMHLTRTLHPPGGATALIAVISGPSIRDLGFGYLFSPVLVGVLIMLAVALLVNNLSSNKLRHYPRFWF
ncbi:MAG: HPP family protein [Burkholderiaceae bacterium]|nr:HPP family protein [Burkholderiaceae bacterium]